MTTSTEQQMTTSEWIPKEKLKDIKAGATRWYATSSGLTLILIAEIERLHEALERAENIIKMRDYRAKEL